MTKIKNEPDHVRDNELRKELDAIAEAILTSTDVDTGYNLEVEVFWSAMNYLKHNPDKTIEEACAYGIGEWIK